MNKVKELFGRHIERDDVDWKSIASRQYCPYIKKKCTKTRKSIADVSIGICTINNGRNNDVMICPRRMLERNQIFTDCLHLLSLHVPGNELHLLSEISIPGGSVDYFLASVCSGKIVDFVGIELQTLDTTGSLWSERSLLLKSKGVEIDNADLSVKTSGINWKMSAKTVLMQIHHKIQTFEHVNKHLVLVVQDCFLNYMEKEFDFSRMQSLRQGDPFHVHSYSLDEIDKAQLRLKLDKRISSDANGIAVCLGLQAEANMELDEIIKRLESRLSDKTVLNCV